jgi:two-component system cell cycle sensor histidine kinase/response regulator CckA
MGWFYKSIDFNEMFKESRVASVERVKRILVMDDEEIVGDIAKQMLVYLGYDVMLAQDGREALSLYKAHLDHHDRFDVVIMDLSIPGGMGGKETVQEILAVDPGAKVVVSSGYSNDPIMVNCKAFGFSSAIAKPFDMKSLKSVIEELLQDA